MKRLTISASRQRSTVRFGVEAYMSRRVFVLLLDFWPLAITVRYGKPPVEIADWGEYDAP
jgi:hypothetical protein